MLVLCHSRQQDRCHIIYYVLYVHVDHYFYKRARDIIQSCNNMFILEYLSICIPNQVKCHFKQDRKRMEVSISHV